MNDATRRDLARIGVQLGEDSNELFTLTLRALGSSQSGSVGSHECIEYAAAQVYDEAKSVSDETDGFEDSSPDESDEAEKKDVELAESYVRTFLSVYEISSLSDVDDLLGREAHEVENYTGQRAFIS